MLDVKQEIELSIKSNTSTVVGIPVVSKYSAPRKIVVFGSCGCTKLVSNFVIQPFETYILEATITRKQSGNVSINFKVESLDGSLLEPNENILYQTLLKITTTY